MMSAAFPWPSCELCNHSFHSTQIKQAYSQATECRDVAQSSMNSLRSPMPDPDTSHTSNRLLDARACYGLCFQTSTCRMSETEALELVG
jgi:hypothetical protein